MLDPSLEYDQRIDYLFKEKESQRQNLRILDTALMQLAFAYITVVALCIPALITASGHIEAISNNIHVIMCICSTALFIGIMYSLLIVRSRNIHLAHIAFLCDRINDLLSHQYGEKNKILFQQSTEISDFYYGKGGKVVWVVYYLALVLIMLATEIVSIWVSLKAGQYLLAFIVLFELIVLVVLYFLSYWTTGLETTKRKINYDYAKWYSEKEDTLDQDENNNSSESKSVL